jgi:hypothetical protein
MKNKEKLLIVGVCVLVVIIALLAILIGYNYISNKDSNKKEELENSTEITTDDSITYICSAKQEETEFYVPYLIEELITKDGRVLESTSYVQLKYSDQSDYEEAKSLMENITYDDTSLTINTASDVTTDYTKDADGEELNLEYETYKTDLENVGYVCNLK